MKQRPTLIAKPLGYQSDVNPRRGSQLFGACEVETYLFDETLDEQSPPFAIFKGPVSDDKIRRIAAILNEEEA